jgi:hypothetical protein
VRPVDRHDIDLMVSLVNHAGVFVENSHLLERLRREAASLPWEISRPSE